MPPFVSLSWRWRLVSTCRSSCRRRFCSEACWLSTYGPPGNLPMLQRRIEDYCAQLGWSQARHWSESCWRFPLRSVRSGRPSREIRFNCLPSLRWAGGRGLRRWYWSGCYWCAPHGRLHPLKRIRRLFFDINGTGGGRSVRRGGLIAGRFKMSWWTRLPGDCRLFGLFNEASQAHLCGA